MHVVRNSNWPHQRVYGIMITAGWVGRWAEGNDDEDNFSLESLNFAVI